MLYRERIDVNLPLLAYRLGESIRVGTREYGVLSRDVTQEDITERLPIAELAAWVDGLLFGVHWQQVKDLPASREVLNKIKDDIVRPMGVTPPGPAS